MLDSDSIITSTSFVKQQLVYQGIPTSRLEVPREQNLEESIRIEVWRGVRLPLSAFGRCGPTRGSGKEVIQPQVPLRLPCYDFAPVTALAFGRLARVAPVPTRTSGARSSHGVTGGVYKARERIHRGVADPRLLAIPASCRRVADDNPN